MLPSELSRRGFLALGGGLITATACPVLAHTGSSFSLGGDASLAFHHLHTGELLRRTFWADGRFISEHLAEINRVLRDHRSGETATIAPDLLVLLFQLQQRLGTDTPFEVISAYRSPTTNAKLAARSNGVAKRSLHMDGKAIDIRLPGVPLATLRQAAIALQGGGVGYYPDSQFVHLDVGRVRRWG